ncbi:MAG: hypothetical protein AAF579_22725 [Cyanobacteria bacterium P01_C01_bin.118]
MTPQDITTLLTNRFGNACDVKQSNTWQVETPELRLLVLLSPDNTWLRLLVPIAPLTEAQPFWAEILAANFEHTVQYAAHENLLWGSFQHNLARLETDQFSAALDQLIDIKQAGLAPFFNTLIESRVRQLIQAAKLQGQSMEATMQTISRFYAEGMMGDMQDSQYGERALIAWQKQLERLWPEVNPPEPTNND